MRKNLLFIFYTMLLCSMLVLSACGEAKKESSETTTKETIISTTKQLEESTTKEAASETTKEAVVESTSEAEEEWENPFVGTVWVGKKKDVWVEFYIQFLNNRDVYVLQKQEGNVVAAEKGKCDMVEDEILLIGVSMISNPIYNEATMTMSATMEGSGLLFTFRPSEEALLSKEELEEMVASTDDQKTQAFLDGWPEDVPVPKLEGDLDYSKASRSMTLTYKDTNPDQVMEFKRTLQDAGFEVLEESEKESEVYVDKNGNPATTHLIDMLNGKIEENEFFSELETGYAIEIRYTTEDEYDKESRQFVRGPIARIILYFGRVNP